MATLDEAQAVKRSESPLARLARIRQMLDKMDLLVAERQRLVLEALDSGNYSQRQIGSAAGLSQTYVSNLRLGKRIKKPSLRQVATAAGLSHTQVRRIAQRVRTAA
jgi:DNA-directed RNA polymerase specialized sigma subunit